MGKRIMIVDSVGATRKMMRDILTPNGYEVAGEAANGVKAVELYREVKPDLVIMAIALPEMDGLEAIKAIKEEDPSAKVMMCSGMGQKAMVVEAVMRGASDFLCKPFAPEQLLEKVKNLCG